MHIVLNIVDGPLCGQSISFRGPLTVTLGRTKRSDYVLEADPQISSLHLQLEFEMDACFLRDLNSSNGTWVNGERVETAELDDGDLIRIGKTTLKVSIEGRTKPHSTSRQSDTIDSANPRDTASRATADTTADRPYTTVPPEPLEPPVASIPPACSALVPRQIGVPSVLLRIETENNRGHTISIRAGQHLTVGRDEQSDIVVSHDPHLSSLHFSVKFDGSRCELRDLDSTNGVAVNGIAVRTAELHDGDEILAGETLFRVACPIVRLMPDENGN